MFIYDFPEFLATSKLTALISSYGPVMGCRMTMFLEEFLYSLQWRIFSLCQEDPNVTCFSVDNE
jgi:hypothetical protein